MLFVHPGKTSFLSQKYGGVSTSVGSKIVDISFDSVTQQIGILHGLELRGADSLARMVAQQRHVACSCGLLKFHLPKSQFASRLLDATRLSDSSYVVLKLVKISDHPFELEIGQFLSSQTLAGASGNHCVPIYDTLHVPDDSETAIIVMPLLLDYRHPPFDTVGEVVECFRQLFEVRLPELQSLNADFLQGLQFMHKHRVAHRLVNYRCTTTCG